MLVSCADHEASWSEPSGQERALLWSKQLQWQRSPPPLTSDRSAPIQGELMLHSPWPSVSAHAMAPAGHILMKPSLRISSGGMGPSHHREQDGQTFAPTSLYSPKSCGGSYESARDINNLVSPARALRQLLLPKRLHHGSKPAFNTPAWGKAWLSAHLHYKLFGNEYC